MAAPLYFVETDCLTSGGFPWPDDASLPGLVLDEGPSGKPGNVFHLKDAGAMGGTAPPIRYSLDLQTWFNCRTHWIGITDLSPVQPSDVQHNDDLVGSAVKLGHGYWHVPTLRYWYGGPKNLPTESKINDQGNCEFDIVRSDYADLWDLVQRAYWTLDPNESHGRFEPMDNAAMYELIVGALSINYRLTMHELVAFGLADQDNAEAAIEAILGLGRYSE